MTGKTVDLVIYRECSEGSCADRNMHKGTGEFIADQDMTSFVRIIMASQSVFPILSAAPRRGVWGAVIQAHSWLLLGKIDAAIDVVEKNENRAVDLGGSWALDVMFQ